MAQTKATCSCHVITVAAIKLQKFLIQLQNRIFNKNEKNHYRIISCNYNISNSCFVVEIKEHHTLTAMQE